MEDEIIEVHLRTLDGKHLVVPTPRNNSIAQLKQLLGKQSSPECASVSTMPLHFHLLHRGSKLKRNASVSSLSLQEGDFLTLVPYTKQPFTNLQFFGGDYAVGERDVVRTNKDDNSCNNSVSEQCLASQVSASVYNVTEDVRREILAEINLLNSFPVTTSGTGVGNILSDNEIGNRATHSEFPGRSMKRIRDDGGNRSAVPIMQRLHRTFSALNTTCGFLQKQHVQPTWRNVREILQQSAVNDGILITLQDIQNFATICPQVVTTSTTTVNGDEICKINLLDPSMKNHLCEDISIRNLISRRQIIFRNTVKQLIKNLQVSGNKEITIEDLLLEASAVREGQSYHIKRSFGRHKKLRRCTEVETFSATEMIVHLKQNLGSLGQIMHCEKLSQREARYSIDTTNLSEPIEEALTKFGINRLYLHQAEAINAAMMKRHVVVATSTASGKSLCYNIPVLEQLLNCATSCALYVFPTKALAQDQLRALLNFTSHVSKEVVAGVYDGDTPLKDRQMVRHGARIIFTNPDMLHTSILPSHKQFERLLCNLRYVVIDEAHAYRGAFGCHTAHILRRLRRLCRHLYGSSPTFIVCSATIANPREHVMDLTGLNKLEVVDVDGSPCGEKHFLLWNPPPYTSPGSRSKTNHSGPEGSETKRSSPIVEIALLFAEMVQHGLRCITFCNTRKLCELVLSHTCEILKETAPQFVGSIRSYRAGYVAQERRSIEKELFAGKLRGIVATNALELGIDIGSLDATLHLGFPGTVASLWQQAGRAGRREKPSISIYVAFGGPLDQHFMRDPQKLFARSIEHAQIDPYNQQVLEQHLQCAAFEHPLHLTYDDAYFGSGIEAVIQELVKKGLIGRNAKYAPQDTSWHYIGPEKLPSYAVSIRAIDPEKYTVVNEATEEVIEEVEANKAFFEVYEGAIYLHQGKKYLVKSIDISAMIARCGMVDVKYYTKTRDFTDVQVVGGDLAYPRNASRSKHLSTSAQASTCKVTTRWIGFRRIWQDTHQTFDSVDLFLPDVSYDSQAAWIRVPYHVRADVEANELSFRAGLHAASHALLNVLPLYIMCNTSDVGTECANPHDTRHYPERLLIFDKLQGGIGIAAQARHFFGELLLAAFEQINSCECSRDTGCPSCIQNLACSEYNEVIDKQAAIMVLEGVIKNEDIHKQSDQMQWSAKIAGQGESG